jgi:AcrR family transcriptional regulator
MGSRPYCTLHEHVLDVASDLFYRRGIGAVGVDAIVAGAGIAKMTLYQHFRSKEELILAFLRRRDERWRAWLCTAAERRTTLPSDQPRLPCSGMS